MTVVPVTSLGRRMPEAGRIRLGIKTERGAPKSIQTLRFTSDNETAIREIAALYEGDVRPWNPRGSRSEWEVITKAKSVPVILPPDPLGGTPVYEMWSGGGLIRRCDGESCTIARQTPDGAEQAQVPCLCLAADSMDCTVTTRLSVILPDIHFAGSWRLETHGWYAAKELPGMVDTILALQSAGFARAVLALEKRSEVKHGQTRNFVVPVLRSEHTVNEIVGGAASLGALASPEAARPLALPPPPLLDDQVAEAELVDEDEQYLEREDDPPPPAEPPGFTQAQRIAIRCRELDLTDDDRHAIAHAVTMGRTSSTRDLTAEEAERVLRMLGRLSRGEVVYAGITDGRAIFRRAQEAQ